MYVFNIPLGGKSKPGQTPYIAIFQNGRQNPNINQVKWQ